MAETHVNIPNLYKAMEEKGLTDVKKNYLFFDEMEWLPIKTIQKNYVENNEYKNNIVPFAITGGGDNWVWVFSESNCYVGYHSLVEEYGIYYAKNMEDAILRNVIDYVYANDFYLGDIETESYKISKAELHQNLDNWSNGFNGIICDEYVDLIRKFKDYELKNIKGKHCERFSLLTKEEEKELIDRYITFDKLDTKFEILKI